jgi:tetratricopeptide (TPR) repeat protein
MRYLVGAALATCVLMLAGAATAQSYAQARQACLLGPFDHNRIIEQCTIILDSGRLTPLERAVALNNRAEMGKDQAANIADLDEAIRLAPRIAKLYHNRGLQKSADPARAIDDFDAAIRLDSKYAVAWTSRGEAYAELKQYDLAIRDLSEAIRLAPGYIHPMYNPYESRARAKEAKGDVKGAEADRALSTSLWRRADKIRPGRYTSGRRAWEGWLSL